MKSGENLTYKANRRRLGSKRTPSTTGDVNQTRERNEERVNV